MKTVVFTSAAINYLAKARTLVDSLAEHDADVETVLLLNDRFPSWLDPSQEPFDHIWHPSDLELGQNPDTWIYGHNIMELSTAVKGPALERILNELQPDLAIYLDPDSLVFNSTSMIDELLGDASIGLAPHICRPEESEEGVRLTEMSVLKHGIYNLGFLAVRNDATGTAFAGWWGDRLRKHCRIDFERGLFTDQRWMDLVPAIFDNVEIIKHPGVDLATWNASGRDLGLVDGTYQVDGKPLFFYHFSGVGPKGVHRWVREKMVYDSVGYAAIESDYEALINARGQQDLAHRAWGYATYRNGAPIPQEHRTALRDHADPGSFGDPFDVSPGSWYDTVTTTKLRSGKAPVRRSDAQKLFDSKFYAEQLESKGIDARPTLDHYRSEGWHVGLEPNAFFDSGHYKRASRHTPEYRSVSVMDDFSPLDHFSEIGVVWNVAPVPLFDMGWYERANPDVARAIQKGSFGSGYEHYVRFGVREGRNPGPQFDEAAYLRENGDVATAIEDGAFQSGYEHFLRFGLVEGRPVASITEVIPR